MSTYKLSRCVALRQYQARASTSDVNLSPKVYKATSSRWPTFGFKFQPVSSSIHKNVTRTLHVLSLGTNLVLPSLGRSSRNGLKSRGLLSTIPFSLQPNFCVSRTCPVGGLAPPPQRCCRAGGNFYNILLTKLSYSLTNQKNFTNLLFSPTY